MLRILVPLLVTLLLAAPAGVADEKKDGKALARFVARSADRSVVYLQNRQARDGFWLYRGTAGVPQPPIGARGLKANPFGTAGLTALAVYALSASGTPASHASMKKALAWMQANEAHFGKRSPWWTYANAFRLLALARVSPEAHGDTIRTLAAAIAAQQLESGMWSYGPQAKGVEATGDHSNTQLAVYALWIAMTRADAKIDKKVWTRVRDHFKGAQLKDGGFGYRPASGRGAGRASQAKPAMTAAALCSYAYAVAALKGGAKALPRVRKDKVLVRAAKALEQVRDAAYADPYLCWMVERAAAVMDRPLDAWFQPGATVLLEQQTPRGELRRGPAAGGAAYGDTSHVYDTALALLFLQRSSAGTTGR